MNSTSIEGIKLTIAQLELQDKAIQDEIRRLTNMLSGQINTQMNAEVNIPPINTTEQRKLTIEATYCKDWTITQAIREVIQNALDTKTEVAFNKQGKYWVISDKGDGIKLADFLLGRSSKMADDTSMGQFGEGIKIACLVLGRNGRHIIIKAGGKEYSFTFEYDNEWQASLLTIAIHECELFKGTTISIECTDEEIQEARRLFLQLTPVRVLERSNGQEILESPGNLYVNGVFISSTPSFFGYNFSRKDLVNRDRSSVSRNATDNAISNALSNMSTNDLIARLLAKAFEYQEGLENDNIPQSILSIVEFCVEFRPRKEIWRRVIKDIWGKKVCLSGSSDNNTDARNKGWKVLCFPSNFRSSLYGTIRCADDVVTFKDWRETPKKRITVEDKQFCNSCTTVANNIANKIGMAIYPISICQPKNEIEMGHFSSKSHKVAISLRVLRERSLHTTVRTILHEYTHGEGHSDKTREFESDLGEFLVRSGLIMVGLNNEGRGV